METTISFSPVVEKPNWVTVELKYWTVKIRKVPKQNIAPRRLTVLLRGFAVRSESDLFSNL